MQGKCSRTSVDESASDTEYTRTADDNFAIPAVNEYFAGKGNFVQQTWSISTGSITARRGIQPLDTFLTARNYEFESLYGRWNDWLW